MWYNIEVPEQSETVTHTTPNMESQLDDLQAKLDAIPESHGQVLFAATEALKTLSEVSPRDCYSSKQITEAVFDKLGLSLRSIGRSSFSAYLSRAKEEEGSRVISVGRGRNGGYKLLDKEDKVLLAVGQTDSEISIPAGGPKTQTSNSTGERALYPVFKRWLLGLGYRAEITGAKRGLGKWSNPDVTGILVKEHLGRLELDIATIEVKRDLIGWEQFFFEAVSHRRYANRSYFAFPVAESSPRRVPDEMKYYSELYHVGVLALVMGDAEYKEFIANKLVTFGDSDDLVDDYVKDIVEVSSAHRGQVPLDYQREFCEALDIKDLQSLYKFGS